MFIGFGELGFDIRAFVENEACALLERLGKKIQYAVERRHGTRGDDVRFLDEGSCFGARRHYAHVGELEQFDSGIHKAGFLLSGFDEGEADIRQHDGKRNAGEAGSSTGIEHTPDLGKMAPGRDGIADVLDSGFFGTGEPREIHVLVGGNDEIQMLGRFRDQAFAMGDFGRKNAIQFFFKGAQLHVFIMASLSKRELGFGFTRPSRSSTS
jgi:hypothetical protein